VIIYYARNLCTKLTITVTSRRTRTTYHAKISLRLYNCTGNFSEVFKYSGLKVQYLIRNKWSKSVFLADIYVLYIIYFLFYIKNNLTLFLNIHVLWYVALIVNTTKFNDFPQVFLVMTFTSRYKKISLNSDFPGRYPFVSKGLFGLSFNNLYSLILQDT